MVKLGVFVSQGHRDKAPQTGGLKTTEIYPLTVLEAASLRLRCQQGWFLLRLLLLASLLVSRELPAIFGVPWLVGALPNVPISVFMFTWHSHVCVCLCAPISPFYKNTSSTG